MDRRTPTNSNVSAVPPQQHTMYAGPRLAYHLNSDVNQYIAGAHHQPQQSMPLTVAPNMLSVPVTSGSGGYGPHDALALATHSIGSRWPSVFEQQQQEQQHRHQQQQQQHHHQNQQRQQQQQQAQQVQQAQQQQNGQRQQQQQRPQPFHDLHDILDPVPLRPSAVQPGVLGQARSPSFTLPLLSQTVSPASYTSGYPVPTPPPDFVSSGTSNGSGAYGQQQQQQAAHQQRAAAAAAAAAGWQAHAARSIAATPSSMSAAAAAAAAAAATVEQPVVGRQGTRGILPSAPLGRDDMGGGGVVAPEDDIDPQQDPSSKKWMCPSCPATFSFPKHVKRHYMRHTGERPYECLCCRACFARSDVLKRHYEKCTERTPGWRDVAPEDRLDHLHGRRGRPKKSMPGSGKKGGAQQALLSGGVLSGDPSGANGGAGGRSKRRRAGSVGTSGQSSEQNSRRNSRDELAAVAALQHAVAESEDFNQQSMALTGDDISS